jgi:hypothetical protein
VRFHVQHAKEPTMKTSALLLVLMIAAATAGAANPRRLRCRGGAAVARLQVFAVDWMQDGRAA